MIKSFKNQGTEDVFNGEDSKQARKVCPNNIWKVARRKLDRVGAVKTLEELRIPPGNQLEKLKDDRAGQHGIRINEQYRVCFRWTGTDAEEVEITDYH